MRLRSFALLASAVMTLMGTVAVAPAAYANPMPCPEEFEAMINYPQAAGIVTYENGQVRISPSAATAWINSVANHIQTTVPAHALCIKAIVDPTVNNVVAATNCTIDKAEEIATSIDPANKYFRYVYEDPTTGDVVIDLMSLNSDIDDVYFGCWKLVPPM